MLKVFDFFLSTLIKIRARIHVTSKSLKPRCTVLQNYFTSVAGRATMNDFGKKSKNLIVFFLLCFWRFFALFYMEPVIVRILTSSKYLLKCEKYILCTSVCKAVANISIILISRMKTIIHPLITLNY